MLTEPNLPLVTRLIAERAEAHRKYNEALTALDRAIQASPAWPSPPAPYDEQLLPAVNHSWTIIPPGQSPRQAGWRGRIADAAWQVVAPVFERQMAFNAAVVEHLNRNAVPHREANGAIAAVLPVLREGFEGLVRFESLLIQFLQQLTPLADARAREMQDAIDELRHVADVAQRAAVMAKREVERPAPQVLRHRPTRTNI